jgi:hypothetical protein
MEMECERSSTTKMGLKTEGEGTKVRLMRIALEDYDLCEYLPGQRLADIGPLREVAPEGCGMQAGRCVKDVWEDSHVLWTIVVAVPTGLSEEGWSEVRRRMQGVLEMELLLQWKPVPLEEEGPTLEAWEKELSDFGWLGSWGEVRAALGLRAETKQGVSWDTELAAEAGRCLRLNEEVKEGH